MPIDGGNGSRGRGTEKGEKGCGKSDLHVEGYCLEVVSVCELGVPRKNQLSMIVARGWIADASRSRSRSRARSV